MPMPQATTEEGQTTDSTSQTDETQSSEQQVEQQTERPLSRREMAMNAIVVRRETDEEQQAATPMPPPAPTPVPPAPAAPAVDDQVALQTAGPSMLGDDDLNKLVRTKVDGVEETITVAEMRRRVQIAGAAEARLREANRLLAEARAASQPPVGNAPATQPADSSTTPPPQGEELTAKQVVKALFEGDEAAATVVVERLMAGRGSNAPTLDPAQLAAQLTPAIRQQIVDETALDTFMAQNADIAKDPHLASVTEQFLHQEMRAGRPYVEALQEAGRQTRDWIKRFAAPAATPTPPATTSRDEKLAHKQSMDNVPALNRTASTSEPQPKTHSDVLAEMRKARGLPA